MLHRARHPFRAGLASAVFAAVVFGLTQCSDFREGYERGFKAEFERTFTKSCAEEAVRKNMPAASAQTYCACTAHELASKYTSSELMKISESSESKELAQAIKACGK